MTRKSRRERREASKIAKGMERRLLRGTFKQELKDLHFEDIKLRGSTNQLLKDLADKECLAQVLGETLGLRSIEVTQMVHAHENRLAYNDRGKPSQLLQYPIRPFTPVLDKDPTR